MCLYRGPGRSITRSHLPPLKSRPVSELRRRIAHVQGCRNAGMGYCEMPVQIRDGQRPGPSRAGAELDRRRRSVIKSQVHRQIYEFKYIYIPKTVICITSFSSVDAYSVAGKYAHCLQRITGSRPVCTFLEPWYVLVCTGMY